MSQLSSFSPQDKELIISLPYKVGICVSFAEDEEGERDDENEAKAMEKALKRFASQSETSPLVQEIANEILKRRKDWSGWSEYVFNLEPVCEDAIKTLKPVVPDHELRAYIKMVLDIASDVAQAYGEFGFEEEQPKKGVLYFVKKIIKGNADADQPMNVSPAEDDSITRITRALKKYA